MKTFAISISILVLVIVCQAQDITIDVSNGIGNETNTSEDAKDLEGNVHVNATSDTTGQTWVDGLRKTESDKMKTAYFEDSDNLTPNNTELPSELELVNETLTELELVNETLADLNVTEADNATVKRVFCLTANLTNSTDQEMAEPVVLMLNNTEFQARLVEEYNSNVTNRSSAAPCSLTMFYAPWCPFSASAAPHFNALARIFPDLRLYAVDSSLHHSLNTQFGIMALPTILIFHNSRPLYKYNYTDYSLAKYAEFVNILTGIDPLNVTLEPTEEDFLGPVPTKAVVGVNYYLWLACIFSLLYGLVQFSKSPVCERMVDTVRNLWREAEIQHEHAE